MKYEKVFVPVSVDERKPIDWSCHFIYNEDEFQGEKIPQSLGAAMFEPEKNEFDFSDDEGGEYRAQPTHWLEEKRNVYVMSEEELYRLLSETFNAGDDYASYSFGKTASEKPNLAKFLKDKLKTTTP